jgi:hypothetical protein
MYRFRHVYKYPSSVILPKISSQTVESYADSVIESEEHGTRGGFFPEVDKGRCVVSWPYVACLMHRQRRPRSIERQARCDNSEIK